MHLALGKGPNSCKEKPVEPPVAGQAGADHIARMHCVAHDALGGQAPVQLLAHEQIAQL